MSGAHLEDGWPAGLGAPARRALAGAGYARLEQLTRVRVPELLRLHGMGPRGIQVLRQALAERGWTFADHA